MEEFKHFEDLAIEQGGIVEPWQPTEEFLRDFEEFMKKSIQESRLNQAIAEQEAKNIIIY